MGLAFPYLFLFNLLLLIYWWFQLKLKMVIPLCFGIFNLVHVSKYIQYTAKNKELPEDFVVATYNTQLFGGTRDSSHFLEFIHTLEKDSVDILCLQEVFSIEDLKRRVQKIKKAGNFATYNFVRLKPDRPYGMVIFSKYSILANGRVGLGDSGGNMAIWADIKLDKDTIRLFNLHLESIRFSKGDYAFIENRPETNESAIEGSKNLLKRLRNASVIRASQADSVASYTQRSPYPVFVAGDFNDVPLSYSYNTIGKNLLDAFRERGNGFEQTYKGPFPDYRIDYILFNKNFLCTSYRSFADVPGDHKMVRASFRTSAVVQ